MSVTKTIKDKISSVKSTSKITSAMEMVAASKMRKAQDNMRSSKHYSDAIRSVVSNFKKGSLGCNHHFLTPRPNKRVGLLLISTDRGLCGGLNINLFKMLLSEVDSWQKKSVECDFATIGSKGATFVESCGGNIIAHASGLKDKPSLVDTIGVTQVLLDKYNQGEIDSIYVFYNKFINTMKQEPTVTQLLPLPDFDTQESNLRTNWNYIYEPDSISLLDFVCIRYVEFFIYQCVMEGVASEMAARMVAMRAASDNAGDLIKNLQLVYNKARQASITQELSEIVGGAAAV